MRRVVALAVVGVLPWTAIIGSGLQLVFLWGLVNPSTLHVVHLYDYLVVLTGALPDRLLAWPTSTVLYVAGFVAAVANERGRGDVQLTAGLFGLSALAHAGFVLGLARRGTATVVPLGPALVAVTLWWFYWPALRREIAR